jgi:ubiquinone/menaquinone biosynthesis C-methylase UbiE
MNKQKRQTHLEYYKEQNISPVRYDMSDMQAHLQRRESLYNHLGLPGLAFRGSAVLEVAAGTGHNSLYLASQMPKKLVLLEPNPTGIDHIRDIYKKFSLSHSQPVLICKTLEYFDASEQFDVVLCENWLGTADHEIKLLKKLASMVAVGGILVVTTVSPIGFLPNLLRRFFVPYLASETLPFIERTSLLEAAYKSHLGTLGAMTRNITDWVQDNMLNPAYFGLCLSSPKVIELLGTEFEMLGSCPSISEDWRWFKSLYGENRMSNQHFLDEYWSKCHNFVDYRQPVNKNDYSQNIKLEEIALRLLKAVEVHEDACLHSEPAHHLALEVACLVGEFSSTLPVELVDAKEGLTEILHYINKPTEITPEIISKLIDFGGLFGRETSYLSLQKT